MKKQCAKCGEIKDAKDFSKYSKLKSGLNSYCRECISKNDKERHLKEPWKRIYNDMRYRCTNPKCKNYKYYGAKGIKLIMSLEDLKMLWFRDKAHEMKKFSRIITKLT